MAAYKTIVVGTDGSSTASLAVDRAGKVAADCNARLVIVCAYERTERPDPDAQAALGSDWMVVGSGPAEDVANAAADRVRTAGAPNVETMTAKGSPVDVLDRAVSSVSADLLVVGNVGLNTLTGRILGSVPQNLARRSGVDVLIVHTS